MIWKQAIEDAVSKTAKNIKRYDGQFPHVSVDGGIKYEINPNTDWTDGFWSGILWLCYEYTGDTSFRDAARKTVESFKTRLEHKVYLDHHDIGFLYSLSSKAQWMIEKDEEARQLTLQAADHLMSRWRPKSGIIQAWGPEGDEVNGGRIIIDCLLNLPLLYWAYEQTGNNAYLQVAIKQADQSQRFLVRGDDSSYHTFYFDQKTGDSIRGGTHQGYLDGSTWTRGQAWGIYGFALSYRYTKNASYLETSKRLALYFLERLPADHVAYWDFNAPVDANTPRDSSASAIVACGIIELLSHLDENDSAREYLQKRLQDSMSGLVNHYSTMNDSDLEGFLKHGSYHVRGNSSPDDFVIWGDYYYLEALMRLEKGHKGYWYE